MESARTEQTIITERKKAGGVNAFCSGQCFFSFHFLVFLLDIELRIISLFQFRFSFLSFFRCHYLTDVPNYPRGYDEYWQIDRDKRKSSFLPLSCPAPGPQSHMQHKIQKVKCNNDR